MDDSVKPLSDIPAINRFLSYCRIRTVPSKTVTIHAGDLPDVLYYIIRGSVEVMIEDEEGNEMVLAYLNKGQFFGEMGLFSDSQQRSAWVRTRSQCELAEMTYPRFRQVASESPGLVFELSTQLATRLDRTNRKLGDLAFVDVTGRIAHAIMDLCNEPDAMTHPQGMQIKVSRQELSRLVGCSREMAGRVLKVLAFGQDCITGVSELTASLQVRQIARLFGDLFFSHLIQRFAVDAKRRCWPSFQPPQADFYTATLAIAIIATLNLRDGFVNFLNQLAFTVAITQF